MKEGASAEKVLMQPCGRPLRRDHVVGTLGRHTAGPEGVQIQYLTKFAAARCAVRHFIHG
uniref:Uncharacterized protein n=1 Tax=Aegilops tauschii subsp. strangulata TaxID=200361 RepID=A0A453I219_AEGTS